MITLYPKALVLTSFHPFGGTEMMARSLASALVANGYDANVINTNGGDRNAVARAITEPGVALIMTTGTLPLELRINDIPIWQIVHPTTLFITYIVDAWPYDYVRVAECRDFIDDSYIMPNLRVVSLEKNDAGLIGKGTHYMPTGAYPAPRRTVAKQNADRLMIWASANKELAITTLHSDFAQTIGENNHWGLSERRIASISEALRNTTIVHGLGAIAAAFGEPLEGFVTPGAMPALCAIDSCLKRYRRVKVVRALAGLPVDIYGENWEQYVGSVRSFRLLKPIPDHNHTFGHICQHYAGLVNFDPNFGHGTNERAVSALALGLPIANNVNARTDGITGCISYQFEDSSIRTAAEQLLGSHCRIALNPEYAWEYLVGKLLGDVATEERQ